MQLYTYLNHDKLADDIYHNKLIISMDNKSEESFINSVVTYIQKYDVINLICICAYLNMIIQTKGLDVSIKIQKQVLYNSGFKVEYSNKILFHRYNLLKLIEVAFKYSKKLNGNVEVFSNNYSEAGEFCLALSLINAYSSEKHDFVRQLIRDNPVYYECNDYIEKIYLNRILKSILLYCGHTQTNKHWRCIINNFEHNNEINIKDYIRFISKLWIYMKNEFDPNNLNTFYLIKSKFPNYRKIIDFLSSAPSFDLQNEFNNGMYATPMGIVNSPIYSITENEKCILDLKCLIDSNQGLLFSIHKSSDLEFREFKEKFYSKITENLFIEVVKNIFSNKIDDTTKIHGYPDAVLKTNNSAIIFEFTTSDISFSALSSGKVDAFIKKYSEILLKRSGQSNEKKGKLYQISKHIEKFKGEYNDIYPILVTDNYFGDFDLIDELDKFLTNKINLDTELAVFSKHKLTILSFDDIFTIWMCLPEENREERLILELKLWNKQNKGDYLFSFSRFLLEKTKIYSPDYLKYFNHMMSSINLSKTNKNSFPCWLVKKANNFFHFIRSNF